MFEIKVRNKVQFIKTIVGALQYAFKFQLSDKELLLYSCMLKTMSENVSADTTEVRKAAIRMSKIPAGQISVLISRIVEKKFLKVENNHYIAPKVFLNAVNNYPKLNIEIISDGSGD